MPEASSVNVSAVLDVGKSALSPVASCLSPGHSVGLIVGNCVISCNVWEDSLSIQVLLLVVESDNLQGISEVDDVKLIILKVGYCVVVAENECDGVGSRTIPGNSRSEIDGELIADGSV